MKTDPTKPEKLGGHAANMMDHVRTGAGAKQVARDARRRALWDGENARKARGVSLGVIIDGEPLPADLRIVNAVGVDRFMGAVTSAVAMNKPAPGAGRRARKRFWRELRARTVRGVLAAGGL